MPFDITSVLSYQMNGILFIYFNLAACAFLKFGWYKMFNDYVDLSFNIFSLRMSKMLRMYQSKRWKIEDGLNETWVTSNSCIFLTFLISSYRQKSSIFFIYFFLYVFFITKIRDSQDNRGRGRLFIYNSSLLFPPTSQILIHLQVDYRRELTSVHSYQLDSSREPLVSERKPLTSKLRALKK